MNKQTVTTAFLTLLLTACGSEPDAPVQEERAALAITSQIGVATVGMTRATGVSWDEGDAIGVFATPSGNTAQTITGGANVQYTTTVTTGTTTVGADSDTYTYTPAAFTATEPVYLPGDGSAVTVYAYYPYNSGATDATKIPVSVGDQRLQSAIDFMRAKNDRTTLDGTTAITKHNKTTELLFCHKLSKVVFMLTPGTGMSVENLTYTTATLTIGGQPTEATYDIYSDGITVTAGSADITALTVNNGLRYEAILLPNTTGAESGNPAVARPCSLTIGPTTYTFTIPETKTFQAGHQTNYTLTVHSTGIVVNADVEPWGAGKTVSLSAQ